MPTTKLWGRLSSAVSKSGGLRPGFWRVSLGKSISIRDDDSQNRVIFASAHGLQQCQVEGLCSLMKWIEDCNQDQHKVFTSQHVLSGAPKREKGTVLFRLLQLEVLRRSSQPRGSPFGLRLSRAKFSQDTCTLLRCLDHWLSLTQSPQDVDGSL